MPNCVLTCNMRNEFVAVRVYQAGKNPATPDELAAGVKVSITSSVYGYTKVLALNLNSKKTSGAAIG